MCGAADNKIANGCAPQHDAHRRPRAKLGKVRFGPNPEHILAQNALQTLAQLQCVVMPGSRPSLSHLLLLLSFGSNKQLDR